MNKGKKKKKKEEDIIYAHVNGDVIAIEPEDNSPADVHKRRHNKKSL